MKTFQKEHKACKCPNEGAETRLWAAGGGLWDVVPCAIQYKINICCYFSKPKSDVQLFLQGESGTKRDFIFFFKFFSLSLHQGGCSCARKSRRRFWRGLKHPQSNPVVIRGPFVTSIVPKTFNLGSLPGKIFINEANSAREELFHPHTEEQTQNWVNQSSQAENVGIVHPGEGEVVWRAHSTF